VQVDAVIVGAGVSTRFGSDDKLYVSLLGRPLLTWSLEAFEQSPSVAGICLVVTAERMEHTPGLARAFGLSKLRAVVPGGARRRDSVEAGLRACSSGYVAIHDAARPAIGIELIERVIAAAEGKAGAIPVIPVPDSLKLVDDSKISGQLDRDRVRAAQTPQVVSRELWLEAARLSDADETDDAAILARLGREVAAVPGDPENIKVTYPADLELAAAILRRRAAGK
jgi:2-C-methyl-D-erythritol 4-phosphate cytidylyltransferase